MIHHPNHEHPHPDVQYANPQNEHCPSCGTTNPLEIVYGMPSFEMFQAAESKLIALGGCLVSEDSPAYLCRNSQCGGEWGVLMPI